MINVYKNNTKGNLGTNFDKNSKKTLVDSPYDFF